LTHVEAGCSPRSDFVRPVLVSEVCLEILRC
jgi:hypothetical protein